MNALCLQFQHMNGLPVKIIDPVILLVSTWNFAAPGEQPSNVHALHFNLGKRSNFEGEAYEAQRCMEIGMEKVLVQGADVLPTGVH